ncbi:hypothetical protein NEHOM01_1060 [Nematocida homosporus]|uniref:uncharacterized protein n=1 Tax=Nematocida homosporus TaxID=1912981 RepID=UPI0022201B3A|nr:uncharacterized protein NEHOM01_1060 [Nematocida homosporus]KAI5185783.1 hypothetical protein NEHOM01_1060 [Nematocida homosporus]
MIIQLQTINRRVNWISIGLVGVLLVLHCQASTLEYLAKTLDFPWAQAVQDLLDTNSLSSYHSEICAVNLPKDPLTPAAKEAFNRDGFYELLFGAKYAHRAKYTTFQLVKLFQPNGLNWIEQSPENILDILMLFAVLNQKRNIDQLVTSTNKLPIHTFLSNLALLIFNYQASHSDFTKKIELVCLKPPQPTSDKQSAKSTNPKPSTPIPFLTNQSLISNEACLAALRTSSIINYVHPLNIRLHMLGINYNYTKSTNAFIVFKHLANNEDEPRIKNLPFVTAINHNTFQTAHILLHAQPKHDCTIITDQANKETFTKILGQFRQGIDLDKTFNWIITEDDSYSANTVKSNPQPTKKTKLLTRLKGRST